MQSAANQKGGSLRSPGPAKRPGTRLLSEVRGGERGGIRTPDPMIKSHVL
jgi:hypothetical protein